MSCKFNIIHRLYELVELEGTEHHFTHILNLPDDLKCSRSDLIHAIYNYCAGFLEPNECLKFKRCTFEYKESIASIKEKLTTEAI